MIWTPCLLITSLHNHPRQQLRSRKDMLCSVAGNSRSFLCVNIGSVNGQAGQYGQVNYAAAKSGIHGFTKALAQEGAKYGITVNAIAPGYVDTEMVRAVPPDVLQKIIARIPVGRLGTPKDIARGVVFLTSDESDFVTGSTVSINGGQHMY
jgi:acetoacetyl-CoA reductase